MPRGFIPTQHDGSQAHNCLFTNIRSTHVSPLMAKKGIALAPDNVIWDGFTHEAGYSGLTRLMMSHTPPTALFCGNDVIAIGALEAAKQQGIIVPEELSIIGIDDIPMASWSFIGLTTIQQSIPEIGSMSARRLAERIETRNTGPITCDKLPTKLVRRATTGRPKV